MNNPIITWIMGIISTIIGIFIGVWIEPFKRNREALVINYNLYKKIINQVVLMYSMINLIPNEDKFKELALKKQTLYQGSIDGLDECIYKARNLDNTRFFDNDVLFLLEQIKWFLRLLNNKLETFLPPERLIYNVQLESDINKENYRKLTEGMEIRSILLNHLEKLIILIYKKGKKEIKKIILNEECFNYLHDRLKLEV